MFGQPLRVTRTCVIAPDELEWRFSGSGGPAASTPTRRTRGRAAVRHRGVAVARAAAAGPAHRAARAARADRRLRAALAAPEPRARDRAAARTARRKRHIDPPRVATRPSRSSKRARVEQKRRQGERKQRGAVRRRRVRRPRDARRCRYVALVLVGVVAVYVVLDAALRTFVLRVAQACCSRMSSSGPCAGSLIAVCAPGPELRSRDRVMALYAPLALLAFPAVALVVIFGAFACFFEAIRRRAAGASRC